MCSLCLRGGHWLGRNKYQALSLPPGSQRVDFYVDEDTGDVTLNEYAASGQHKDWFLSLNQGNLDVVIRLKWLLEILLMSNSYFFEGS